MSGDPTSATSERSATSAGPRPELAALAIADPPERWRALGFAIDERDRVVLGGVELALGGAGGAGAGQAGAGITGWTLRFVRAGGDIDGLATSVTAEPSGRAGRLGPPSPHPNGALGVDHVVIVTPDFDRSVSALAQRGLALRRIRRAGDRRQGFRRLGPAIMEIVEAPEAPAAGFWGLTLVLADLRAPGALLAAQLGEIRPAVQPGRQIATLRAGAGLSARVAFMDPQ
ncbi:MAG: glyoxalase [Solirubrobacteraceae bacterium]